METYISKALAGDHEAFARLYDAYAPEALRLSTAVTGRADLAADAVQEAFLRVYRKGYQCGIQQARQPCYHSFEFVYQ